MMSSSAASHQPEIIEKYFSSINPIASKIHHDITETKSSYEHIWNELNAGEQIDIINETLIKPEIALRYFDSLIASPKEPAAAADPDSKTYHYDGKHLKTYSNQKTAQKFIQDDVIGVFRDEHSAPFSFKTKSQINLNLFQSGGASNSPTNQTIAQNQSIAVLKQQAAPPPPVPPTKPPPQIQKNQLKIIAEATTSMILPNKSGNTKYERFYNGSKIGEATTSNDDDDDDDDDDDFINKFICKNNLIYNKNSNSQIVIVASAANHQKRDAAADDDEKKILVKDISYIGGRGGERDGAAAGGGGITGGGDLNSTTSSLHSEEEDDDKQVYEDSKLLLEASADDLRKGFDFLNNW